jgi:hypothetical protein
MLTLLTIISSTTPTLFEEVSGPHPMEVERLGIGLNRFF